MTALIRGGFLATAIGLSLQRVFCLAGSLLCTVWLSCQYLKIRRMHLNRWFLASGEKTPKGWLSWTHILDKQQLHWQRLPTWDRAAFSSWLQTHLSLAHSCLGVWCVSHLSLALHCFLTLSYVSRSQNLAVGFAPEAISTGQPQWVSLRKPSAVGCIAALCVIPGNNRLLSFFKKKNQNIIIYVIILNS